jgi:hypothetical protein
MQNPADEVIDELGFRERLMTTLVSNDPETSCDKASGKSVEGPERKAGNGIKVGRGKGEMLGGEKGLNVRGNFINDGNEKQVPDTVCCDASDAVMCTMRRELS